MGEIITGDVLEYCGGYEGPKFHGVLCDPPYHLTSLSRNGSPRVKGTGPFGRHSVGERGFMGKTWDGGGVSFDPTTWIAIRSICRPGAMLLAFGGTRTFHRLTCAIEDAGWEIRDCVSYLHDGIPLTNPLLWNYGSGFPKSHDISKAIDKAAGLLEAEGVGFTVAGYSHAPDKLLHTAPSKGYIPPMPQSDAARQWQGYGTALKPAWEPVIVAMNPLDGTFAQNALEHGVAGINVDGCRVPGEEDGSRNRPPSRLGSDVTYAQDEWTRTAVVARNDTTGKGRWPANLIHDGSEEVVGLFPVSSVTGKRSKASRAATVAGTSWGTDNHESTEYVDSGSAARFFYTAKASRRERDAGLEGLFVTLELEVCPCGEDTDLVTSLEKAISEYAMEAGRQGCSMYLSGKKRMERFRRVTVSITSTETSRTTGLTTSPVWISQPTNEFIAGVFKTIEGCGISLAASAESLSQSLNTTKDKAASRPGAKTVVSETPLKISANVRLQGNVHPTLKPLALTEYLARLILPPEQDEPRRLFVPFAGSGSEMIGAHKAGWDEVIGVELEEEYVEIARARLKHWTERPEQLSL